MQLSRILGAGAGALATTLLVTAPAAAEPAEIIHPECGFTAGTYPGVDVDVDAFYCQVVITSAGTVSAHFRAQIPEGYPVPVGTYREDGCSSAITPTGLVLTTCHF